MSTSRPMDPERLAEMRRTLERTASPTINKTWVDELLADRDYQAQQLVACTKTLTDWDPTGRKPAPYSVREAIREAGLDESLSSAEAVRSLARRVQAAVRALEHRWTHEAVLRLLRGDE